MVETAGVEDGVLFSQVLIILYTLISRTQSVVKNELFNSSYFLQAAGK